MLRVEPVGVEDLSPLVRGDGEDLRPVVGLESSVLALEEGEVAEVVEEYPRGVL